MPKQEKDITKGQWWTTALFFLPNALINIAVIATIALMTVVAFDLDYHYLLTPAFYVTSAILFIIYTLTHWSWFDSRLKKRRKAKEYLEEKKEKNNKIKDLTDTLAWQTHREDFVNERNERELIVAWRTFVKNKLMKLRNKARKKDIKVDTANVTALERKTLSETEIEALERKIEDNKQNNKYCIKKNLLELYLTEEWIVKNKDKIRLDYNEIDTLFVETGGVTRGIYKDKAKTKGKYFKDTMPIRFVSLLTTFLISSFAIDLLASGADFAAWTTFCLRMLLLLNNAIGGRNYGDTWFDEVDIHNDDSRVSITTEFKTWALSKNYMQLAQK